MASLVRVNIADPQDVIDRLGAGALYRIERATTSAMADTTEVGVGLIEAGTTEYEFRDPTGIDGSHWYWSRYSTGTPGGDSDYSGYSAPQQAGAPGGQVITLETAKTWCNIGDTVDDAWFPYAVGAMNRAIIRSISVDIGPSPDTTRTYDACKATQEGRRLRIPGGIRAFSTVEGSSDGTTWTAITTAVRVGPLAQARPYGEPGGYIEFKPYNAMASTFLAYSYVRITGLAFATFGWDAYPDDLVQAALSGLQRMILDRRGQGNFPTETDAARYINADLICDYRGMNFAGVA
jgi:hypothetical protein